MKKIQERIKTENVLTNETNLYFSRRETNRNLDDQRIFLYIGRFIPTAVVVNHCVST